MDNYKKQLVTFDLKKIFNISLTLIFVTSVVGILLNIFVFSAFSAEIKFWHISVFIFLMLSFIPVHEALHALGFLLSGAEKSAIKFGMIKEQGMFYCHCAKPMKAKIYRFALILPVVLTGIIPYIITIIFGNFLFVFLFSFAISAGAGDFFMARDVFKLSGNQLIQDHPKAPAYYLIYEGDNLPDNFVEVTEEMEKELIIKINNPPKRGTKKNKK